jgi:hypothetical protein
MRGTAVLVALFVAVGASEGCGGGGSPSSSSANGGTTGGTSGGGTTSGGATGGSAGAVGSPGYSSLLGQMFPANNAWNTDISQYPVHQNSANFIASINATRTTVHPDFGTVYNGAPNGIPFMSIHAGEPLLPMDFSGGAPTESDVWPANGTTFNYPIPLNAPIEGGPNSTGDRHVIVIDVDNRMLFEIGQGVPGSSGWTGYSGAIFNLSSNALRPAGWTSADAAGLPILPGLVRYDEAVTDGVISHALRFTVDTTQHGYILPAEHFASTNTNPNEPPMGLRLRLKASVNITTSYAPNLVIVAALKKYGMIVADNGSSWYISGAPDPNWDDSRLADLSQITGDDFEVVDTGPIVTR